MTPQDIIRAQDIPLTRADVVRVWFASRSMPAPSKEDVASLLALLFPEMPVSQLLEEEAS